MKTQHDLIIEYCNFYGEIVPAKVAGKPFNDGFFGSETPKRCRELRQSGKLRSRKAGKFEVFYLPTGEQSVMFRREPTSWEA